MIKSKSSKKRPPQHELVQPPPRKSKLTRVAQSDPEWHTVAQSENTKYHQKGHFSHDLNGRCYCRIIKVPITVILTAAFTAEIRLHRRF